MTKKNQNYADKNDFVSYTENIRGSQSVLRRKVRIF